MFVSVILTTYESPDWLAKVIWGYAAQTHRHFEVVIADDGSTEATAQCIAEMAAATSLRLKHVWQPKQGFGKCRILNRAIVEASSDYVVFSDGDCIPRCDFLAQHVALAQPRRFLSGGVVRLPQPLSEQITPEDIAAGRATSAGWLVRHGLSPSRKLMMLVARSFSPSLLDAVTTTRATFNGHNTSAWKRDVLHVNGFDERMGYGGLDRELGERLCNAGILPLQIRHRAVCVHLDHPRGYVDAAVVAQNRQMRHNTVRHGYRWTAYGIHQPADVLPFPTAKEVEHAAEQLPSQPARRAA